MVPQVEFWTDVMIPLLEKEGWLRHQLEVAKPPKRRRRARSASAIARSRKSGQFGGMFRPQNFAELTTPAAPFRNGSILLIARPPLLFKEGNIAGK